MRYLPFLICLLLVSPAIAKDVLPENASENMDLFPKSREAYSQKFDSKTEQYEVEKRAYVDNLYEYRGEGGTRLNSKEPMLPESTLDAVLDSAKLPEPTAQSSENPPVQPVQ